MCTHFFLTLGNEGNVHEVKDGKVEGKVSLALAQERTKGLKRVTGADVDEENNLVLMSSHPLQIKLYEKHLNFSP